MAEKIIKRSHLSNEDFTIQGDTLRIKNSIYNIQSNNGAGVPAPFLSGTPLSNWTQPTTAKPNAVAHVLFSDGLGYFTYNGTVWELDFFQAGSEFIFNTESIRPYKVYTALLTQAGTDAPVAIVLENTLDAAIVWSRESPGNYLGTLEAPFLINKTYTTIDTSYNLTPLPPTLALFHKMIDRINDNMIQVVTGDNVSYLDDLLDRTEIEIRVYN